MCNKSWGPYSSLEKNNSLNHSCVSPKMGCLEYTTKNGPFYTLDNILHHVMSLMSRCMSTGQYYVSHFVFANKMFACVCLSSQLTLNMCHVYPELCKRLSKIVVFIKVLHLSMMVAITWKWKIN